MTRVGSTLELVPNLIGDNNRPTGQRGALLWFPHPRRHRRDPVADAPYLVMGDPDLGKIGEAAGNEVPF